MDIYEEIRRELREARMCHATFNNAHEGWAVIYEEVVELQAEVFKKQPSRDFSRMRKEAIQRMRKEAIQIAAMAIRFIEDVCKD